jgi:hypothetical protein
MDIAIACMLVALALRRAKTLSLPLLPACLALVPVFQIPTILWLGLSSVDEHDHSKQRNRVPIGIALQGLIAGVTLTVALVALSTLVFHSYGFGLFLASPFFVGGVTAYIANRRVDIGRSSTTSLVFGASFLGGIALLAVAIEGIVCLALAVPLILLMAWIGAQFGRAIALMTPRKARGSATLSIAALPLFFAVDLIAPPTASFESVETIEVAAPPHAVWDAVVHMGPIPNPPVAPFRWGLAYPMSGTIRGSGVGAIREGVFSTGVAYERVTEWDPDRGLSFIVLSDPPTMRELSPYQHVNAAHVSGYFRTLDARFTIIALPNGHSQLSLATYHELDINPGFYWLPIAKWAVRANKARVLAHFAQQAEAAAATP